MIGACSVRCALIGVTAFVFAGVAAVPASAKVETNSDASSEVVVELGRDVYVKHCASCHGAAGRGGGPVAATLKSAPPDLTLIGVRNEGGFDVAKVAARIDGRDMPAVHGTGDMPVWGARFSATFGAGEVGEEAVRGHLLLLVEYLRSIQR